MVVLGGSIAQWLTFGIENDGVFYTFVYAGTWPKPVIRRRSVGSPHPAWRLACVAADSHSPPRPRFSKCRSG